MSSDSARTAHALASQITSARLRGDLAEANRLVKLFNQQLAGSKSNPGNRQGEVGRTINSKNVSNSEPKFDISDNNLIRENRGLDKVNSSDQSSKSAIPVPRPARPGSLAEAVLEDKQSVAGTSEVPGLESVLAPVNDPDPFSYLSMKQAEAEPVLPDFEDLISSYHPGVQSLLKKTLDDMSGELQTPKQVLGPSLITEFESLWRSKQMSEPLLLKLPKHIQQRSVLLRYQSDLLERLQ